MAGPSVSSSCALSPQPSRFLPFCCLLPFILLPAPLRGWEGQGKGFRDGLGDPQGLGPRELLWGHCSGTPGILTSLVHWFIHWFKHSQTPGVSWAGGRASKAGTVPARAEGQQPHPKGSSLGRSGPRTPAASLASREQKWSISKKQRGRSSP